MDAFVASGVPLHIWISASFHLATSCVRHASSFHRLTWPLLQFLKHRRMLHRHRHQQHLPCCLTPEFRYVNCRAHQILNESAVLQLWQFYFGAAVDFRHSALCFRSLMIRSMKMWEFSGVKTFVIFIITVGCTSSCYVFPDDQRDPCIGKLCSYGAQCMPSLDGLTARCLCPEHCDTFGDNVGSTPVCGMDGHDYDNSCEMKRVSCREMKDIERKFDGRCGEYYNNAHCWLTFQKLI